MAYGNQRRSFRQSGSRRRRGGSSGFRVPIVGIKIPKLFMFAALVGGGIYFFKGQLQPLINKFKSLTSSTPPIS